MRQRSSSSWSPPMSRTVVTPADTSNPSADARVFDTCVCMSINPGTQEAATAVDHVGALRCRSVALAGPTYWMRPSRTRTEPVSDTWPGHGDDADVANEDGGLARRARRLRGHVAAEDTRATTPRQEPPGRIAEGRDGDHRSTQASQVSMTLKTGMPNAGTHEAVGRRRYSPRPRAHGRFVMGGPSKALPSSESRFDIPAFGIRGIALCSRTGTAA